MEKDKSQQVKKRRMRTAQVVLLTAIKAGACSVVGIAVVVYITLMVRSGTVPPVDTFVAILRVILDLLKGSGVALTP